MLDFDTLAGAIADVESKKAMCAHEVRRDDQLYLTTEWTARRIEILLAEWARGASGSAIAATINRETGARLTRCAILGKVYRLRLSGRPRAPKKEKTKRPRTRRTRIANVEIFPGMPEVRPAPNMADAALAFGTPVGLLDLTPDTCRWPVGDPRDLGFAFCGAAPAAGCPYCARHKAIAYDPDKYAVRSQIGTLNLRDAA